MIVQIVQKEHQAEEHTVLYLNTRTVKVGKERKTTKEEVVKSYLSI